MKNALSIANKFVNISASENIPITHMKLQKLVYIANGINLARYGYPLILERVETWPYGPVIATIYNCYKIFGNANISYNPIEIPGDELDEHGKSSFDSAWKIAKGFDGIRLSNWTHDPNSPWSKAKEAGLSIIPDNYMQEFFQGFMPNK